jgi:hypothetical protein
MGASALVVHSAVAKELLFRHNMLLVDALQPSSLALWLWIVLHWATQSRELETDSTAPEYESSLHLVACFALSCRGLDDTAAILFLVACHASSHRHEPVGVILHFHRLHQFSTCHCDADCISETKLRGFTVRSFYAARAASHTSNKTPTLYINYLPSTATVTRDLRRKGFCCSNKHRTMKLPSIKVSIHR